jgi:hypothetical protein
MSRIRIVVADQAEAIFYDLPSLQAAPQEVAHISDPAAHLHNRDLVSDRPGRSYESVGGRGTRSPARTTRGSSKPCGSRAASPGVSTRRAARTSSRS